jgi:hypothetical protein
MLCPLCRWMPCISGCRLAGATPVLLSRGYLTHSASGCPITQRDDGSSGCTVESCNSLFAPRYMLCPLCRWMPRILGCQLTGATPLPLSRECLAHSASGCPVAQRDDGSSGCTIKPCNLLSAPRYMLCPPCRWMPCISGCRLAGATPVPLS